MFGNQQRQEVRQPHHLVYGTYVQSPGTQALPGSYNSAMQQAAGQRACVGKLPMLPWALACCRSHW